MSKSMSKSMPKSMEEMIREFNAQPVQNIPGFRRVITADGESLVPLSPPRFRRFEESDDYIVEEGLYEDI